MSEVDLLALAKRPGWQVDRFEVEPGVTLAALVRRPARADAPWIPYLGQPGLGHYEVVTDPASLESMRNLMRGAASR